MLKQQRVNWGEDRVIYFDAQGRLRSLLTSWTSLRSQDLFAQASAGRSWWRTDDLQHLAMLIDELQKRRGA